MSRPSVGRVRARGAHAPGALRACSALAVALAVSVAGVPSARAADEITTQDYVGVLGVENEVAAGRTGKGIKIGVVDGPADTSLPELQGADVPVKSLCDFVPSADGRSHASAMVSILVARGYGVARDAQVVSYAVPGDDDDDSSGDCFDVGIEDAIGTAVADGVDIISISMGGGEAISDAEREAVAGAVARGVVVVVSTGNEGAQDPADSFASVNGTVGVGAADSSGNMTSYSNYGKGLTVLAPGDGLVYHDLAAGNTAVASGTSVAAPIVAGFLAVTMQQWDGATSNQVLQSLVRTASSGRSGQPLISPRNLDSTDPTQFPDENPLMDKFPGTEPSAAMVEDYRDGLLVSESVFDNDVSYVYRGANPVVVAMRPDRSALGTSPRYHRGAD